jgi:hypothetical protein
MPERRKSRKRHAAPPPEAKRLSLLDLPPAVDPRDELPTNPAFVIRPTTLIPVAAEPIADASLTSLVEAARRSVAIPWAATTTPQVVARAAAAPPTAANFPIDVVQPRAVRPSSLPPPVQMPSEPPRRRSRREGNPWLRTLGVIVLSSSVGALVASLISSAKSDLASRREREIESARGAALAPSCAPATPLNDSGVQVPATVAGKSADAPRITLDALPLQPARPAARSVEAVSLDTASSDRPSQERKSPPSVRHSMDGEIPERSSGETKRARRGPPPDAIPEQPSRAALSQAMARAASAATSCDMSPQDGKVTVTFAPSGAVQSVSLVKGFGDAAVNACVLRAFGRARVPAFSGDPVQVRKSVAW